MTIKNFYKLNPKFNIRKKGFNCTTVSLRKEQMIWYRVHYGLLKSVVVTAASEFIPVLLVAHWYFKTQIFIKIFEFSCWHVVELNW